MKITLKPQLIDTAKGEEVSINNIDKILKWSEIGREAKLQQYIIKKSMLSLV